VTCHSPHSTDFDHQLKAPQEQGCLDCHKGLKAKIKNAPVQHAALKVAEQCANCHDPHGSNEKSLLLARTDSVCLKCHDRVMTATDGHTIPNMKPILTESKFLHGPNRAGNCTACHDPHGAKQPELLQRSFPKTFYTKFDVNKYDLCFTCHEKSLVLTEKTTTLTNFRDGDKNLHFMHVNRDTKGRSCKTCHNVHGSDLPNHLASEVQFEGSSWAMPMQYEKTPDGGKCTPGCHKERTYKRMGPATTQPVASGGVS
jgi:predicted CXXCH cytochrome family protein